MPYPYNGQQSPLEAAAIKARDQLMVKNIYGVQTGTEYSETHTRAMADTQTPEAGKGTGKYLDINSYNAGSLSDKNGKPTQAGSGRNAAFKGNLATWGYDYNHAYVAPDTSKNVGQVII